MLTRDSKASWTLRRPLKSASQDGLHSSSTPLCSMCLFHADKGTFQLLQAQLLKAGVWCMGWLMRDIRDCSSPPCAPDLCLAMTLSTRGWARVCASIAVCCTAFRMLVWLHWRWRQTVGCQRQAWHQWQRRYSSSVVRQRRGNWNIRSTWYGICTHTSTFRSCPQNAAQCQ